MIHRIDIKAVIGALLVVCILAPTARSQRKASSVEPCPDQKTYTGKYRNRLYGFSIFIPAGLKGYWNSARCAADEKYGCVCMPDHGRFIPISDDVYIEAFVSYEIDPEWSVSDYENNNVSSLRQSQGIEQLKVLSSHWIRMGKLTGRRFALQFTEKNKNVVVERVIALYKGVEYQLILRTLAERYPRDRREFEKVVTSWRLTPRIE